MSGSGCSVPRPPPFCVMFLPHLHGDHAALGHLLVPRVTQHWRLPLPGCLSMEPAS